MPCQTSIIKLWFSLEKLYHRQRPGLKQASVLDVTSFLIQLRLSENNFSSLHPRKCLKSNFFSMVVLVQSVSSSSQVHTVRGSFIKRVHNIFPVTNISHPLIHARTRKFFGSSFLLLHCTSNVQTFSLPLQIFSSFLANGLI